ncbi:polysaccharide deacetylase family protein [Thalassotalea sp. SU-HH00458]|uniref:polysaccharide deacetylase family protein n=1 Tax=Thalassotalea sp. SU-HH00458 TaxID=3127657 RepID=UPI003102C829
MLNFLLSIIYWRTRIKLKENPLAILYFHHVFEHNNEYHPDDIIADEFDRKIKFLNKHFNILTMSEAMEKLEAKQLPPKALVITFDDGYQDNFTIAAPILKKHNCPSTFFISTSGVDKGYLWNDEVEQLISNTSVKKISAKIIGEQILIENQDDKINAFQQLLSKLKFLSHNERTIQIKRLKDELGDVEFQRTMMTHEQIKQLHQDGFTIGAHTHSHTILTTETIDICREELLKNKNSLEATINDSIKYIAFPNGLFERDYQQKHYGIAKEMNFQAGFSTNDGGAISLTNTYTIPRFMPYRKQLSLFALSIAKIAGEHV